MRAIYRTCKAARFTALHSLWGVTLLAGLQDWHTIRHRESSGPSGQSHSVQPDIFRHVEWTTFVSYLHDSKGLKGSFLFIVRRYACTCMVKSVHEQPSDSIADHSSSLQWSKSVSWRQSGLSTHLVFGVFIDLKHMSRQLVCLQAFAIKRQ